MSAPLSASERLAEIEREVRVFFARYANGMPHDAFERLVVEISRMRHRDEQLHVTLKGRPHEGFHFWRTTPWHPIRKVG
ncbi:MAG: hypothetical protein ABJE47_23255 [bacterium]